MKRILILIFASHLIFSCSQQDEKKISDNNVNISVPNVFIDSSLYKFEILNPSLDTFKLLSNNDYFYYCFGKFSDAKNLLENYSDKEIIQETTYVYNDTSLTDTLYRIKINNGFLKYYEGNTMGLVSGKILSPDLKMINGIRVGLSKKEVLNILFAKNIPNKIEEFKNIQIETVLTGVWINFYFENDSLAKINVDTDLQVNKE